MNTVPFVTYTLQPDTPLVALLHVEDTPDEELTRAIAYSGITFIDKSGRVLGVYEVLNYVLEEMENKHHG